MATCKKCGQELPDYEFNSKLAALLDPQKLTLYDFGNGTTVLPIPSPDGNGYLVSSMLFLYSTDAKKALGVKVRPTAASPRMWRKQWSDTILKEVARGAALFDQKAEPWTIGDELPMGKLV